MSTKTVHHLTAAILTVGPPEIGVIRTAPALSVSQPNAPKGLRRRKPSLASVAKQVEKAGIAVARYEVDPDGKIVVIPGKPQANQTNDFDKWMAKHAH
jgi:hypothetical protein